MTEQYFILRDLTDDSFLANKLTIRGGWTFDPYKALCFRTDEEVVEYIVKSEREYVGETWYADRFIKIPHQDAIDIYEMEKL